MNLITEIKPSDILRKVAEHIDIGACSFGHSGAAAIWEVYQGQCHVSVRLKAEEYFEIFEPPTPILYWFGWGDNRDKNHCALSLMMAAAIAEYEGN